MRMIIEARIEGAIEDIAPIRLAEIERADGQLKQLGLSLALDKHTIHPRTASFQTQSTRIRQNRPRWAEICTQERRVGALWK